MKPLSRWFSKTVLFAVLSLAGARALAAACCGGGFAAPSILAGDDRAQLTTSLAVTDVVVDNVDSSGIWRRWDDHQRVRTARLEGARLLSDRWQAGFTLPWLERSRFGETFRGLGDVAGSVGYEYLTDWDYHPWRPKGIGFVQLTLPTGKGRAESENGGLDSRGNGFWALGAGTLLTKTFTVWDVFATLEAHRSFDKRVRTSQLDGTLKPGFGGSVGLGAGYNTASWRFGGSVTWNSEDPVGFEGASALAGAAERSATAALTASFLANDEWAATLSYQDQTWFGDPVNTSLGRGAAVLLQRKWPR